MADEPAFFRSDWPFSLLDDASLFQPGRRPVFLCSQVGYAAPSAILIGDRRVVGASVERSARTPLSTAEAGSSVAVVVVPADAGCRCCYEAEVKTPWQSSRTSGKQGRLRRAASPRVASRCDGTPGRGERVREAYMKAAIFREGNQRRAFRAAYHRATPPHSPSPLPLSSFFFSCLFSSSSPPSMTTTTTTTLSSRSHSLLQFDPYQGLFPQPVTRMDLTDEK